MIVGVSILQKAATLPAAAMRTSASGSLSSFTNAGVRSDLEGARGGEGVCAPLLRAGGTRVRASQPLPAGRAASLSPPTRAHAHLVVSGPSASQSATSCCATLYRTRHDLSAANFCTTGSRLARQPSVPSACANDPQLSTASSRTLSCSARRRRRCTSAGTGEEVCSAQSGAGCLGHQMVKHTAPRGCAPNRSPSDAGSAGRQQQVGAPAVQRWQRRTTRQSAVARLLCAAKNGAPASHRPR